MLPWKYQHMPLRVPAGWTMMFNSFYDVDLSEEHFGERLFDEDMLVMERYPKRENSFLVDLGWVPSNNPQGTYRITVVIDDFKNIVTRFESRDRYVIQATLDRWLATLSSIITLEVEEARRALEAS